MAHLEDAIPGLAEFTRWFAEDATRYVVIGGVAREMIYREAGLWEESGTKDFDMVLIAEALDAPFVAKFIQFVREAHYTHVTKSGDAQMFRFCRPAEFSLPPSDRTAQSPTRLPGRHRGPHRKGSRRKRRLQSVRHFAG